VQNLDCECGYGCIMVICFHYVLLTVEMYDTDFGYVSAELYKCTECHG